MADVTTPGWMFNPPPNWPAAPEGWVPPEGWQPDPAWGPAPDGWSFWVPVVAPAAPAPWAMPPAEAPTVAETPLVTPAAEPTAVIPSTPAAEFAAAANAPAPAPAPAPEPGAPQPAPGPSAAPTFLPSTPPAGGGDSWFARHKVLTGVGGAILAVVLINAVNGGGEAPSTEAAQATLASSTELTPEQQAAAKAAAAKQAAAKAAADKKAAAAKAAAERAKRGPHDQQAFVAAAVTARDDIDSIDNELKQKARRKERNDAMCKLVPGGRVSNWVGTVRDIDTNGEGKGVLELEIGDDVKVSTWNNALSDIMDNTLIDMNSAMYATLAELEDGARVRFSGLIIRDSTYCFRESSLTFHGNVHTPNFVFRFSSVAAL